MVVVGVAVCILQGHAFDFCFQLFLAGVFTLFPFERVGRNSTVVGVVVIDGFVVSVDIIELKSITERLFNAALDD